MARKCRLKTCRAELPPAKKCCDLIQQKGFCGMACLSEHGREKAHEARERKEKRKQADTRKASRARNDNDKSHQEELTQQACNRMIRLLDEGQPCISCGRHQCGYEWHAGHLRSVASSPETRFDPRNIHRQGSSCNKANRRPDKNSRRKSETIAQEYESRLRERHGNEMVYWILGPHEMPKFSCDDLRALRGVFNAECRRLERGEGPSRDWRGLDYSVRDLIKSCV